jgi:LysR family cyn operon transcriptional activator
MEMREIRSLIALAERGSILGAAEKCNLSPAAVHKHLKTLEAELGVRLYAIRQGQLGLTEAGAIALPFMKEILLNHQSVFKAIHEWQNANRGLVRIGAGPSFSTYLLPPDHKAISPAVSGR